MRRVVFLSAVAIAALAVASSARAASDDAQRAIAAYVAMQREFFDVRAGLYRNTFPAAPRAWATAWPVSQALAATILVAQTPGANLEFRRGAERRLARTLRRYERRGAYRAALDPGADFYYDDNVWIALDLLDWHALTGGSTASTRAAQLFGFVVAGWDRNRARPCPGGVFWTHARGVGDRNTVSTAGGALLGLRLYELTRRPEILYWSRRMAEWVDTCLAGANGLYGDHIRVDGSVDATQWTYNQGAMIAVDALLARITGDDALLQHARALADAALATFDAQRLAAEPPEFATIFFRDLLVLGDRRYSDAAHAYADALWSQLSARSGRVRLLDQAALTQLYAALALTADR